MKALRRNIGVQLRSLLGNNPAVVLTGPRQTGKTTLAMQIADEKDGHYLDLQNPGVLAQFDNLEEYCQLYEGKLLVMDEIQHVPDLFFPLRGIIDKRRRSGHRTGQFLLIGSASLKLLKQSGESLAGRIGHCELAPFGITEVPTFTVAERTRLWCRGGFPESYLATSEKRSMDWRISFIAAYLERDIPQLGPRIPATTLRRFWIMLAHNQSQLFNAAALARRLGLKGLTVSRYLDLIADMLLVRYLQPWGSNLGRRLVKAPKVHIRDSGLCHALLNIQNAKELLRHPVVGGSWEAFVIENILSLLPPQSTFGYYRTSGGAEVDLVVDLGGGNLWVFEIKHSEEPSVSRGFHSACEDLQPSRKFVVHSGERSFPLKNDVQAICLPDLSEELSRHSGKTLRGQSLSTKKTIRPV